MPAHRSYAPPVNGMLGRVFAQMGHEVTILTTALPAQTPEAAGDAGGQVHFLQGTTPGKMDARFWHSSAQVFDELHSKRPFDLVLGRGAATWGFHSQSRFAALVPVISNEGTYPRWLHRLERHLPNYTPALAKPLAVLHGPWDQIYRKSLQRAACVVCNSAALADALVRAYWWQPPRTAFIPYGFDLAPWWGPTENLPHGRDPMRIVFVGRMTADKGIFDLIDILARLRDPKAYIDAIGPISPLAERRLMAFAHKKGVAGRFNILGAQKNTDLPKLLRGAGVFLFPSTHAEGLSKAVMEAMAASLPVVAYQIQGMDALVKHSQTGWLLPPSDTVAAAQKLDVMLDQPALAQRMGAAG